MHCAVLKLQVGRGDGWGSPGCSQVPIWVPQVLNVSSKGVPNSTSLYPISFAQSIHLLTYIGEPKGRYSILT